MSELRPETLEVPDRVRRQIEDMAERLAAAESELDKLADSNARFEEELGRAESALTEALDAGDLIVRRFAGRKGRTVRKSDVLALDDLMFTLARIRSQIEGSNDDS